VNDIRGLAPEGFVVPSEADWERLKEYIGGVFNGGKLKSTGLTLWKKENKGATNETGFSVLPAGFRYHFGDFSSAGESARFWSSTMLPGVYNAYYCDFGGNTGNYGFGYTSPQNGYSVRLIKKGIPTVKIESQYWMDKSLDLFTFRNGDPIPQAKNLTEWMMAGVRKTPALMVGACRPEKGERPVVYYNWYAVNDKRNLAPQGFHIPTQLEWESLIWLLGNEAEAGKMLVNGTFSGEKAGMKLETGNDSGLGSEAGWWSTTEKDSAKAGALYAPISSSTAAMVLPFPKGFGIAVRCLADSSVSPTGPEYGIVKDIAGTQYKTIKLGKQTWMAENLWASKFNDGREIPFASFSLGERTTPAYSDYTVYNKYSQKELNKYGAYFNGYTALEGNPCPPGWHVPTRSDIEELIAFLGERNDPEILKSTDKSCWEFSPGNNKTGFSALGAGYLSPQGLFRGQRNGAEWWSSTRKDDTSVWTMYLGIKLEVYQKDINYGLPIRCIKD
jgi:uncharacterized protein (TIGR02145 family)